MAADTDNILKVRVGGQVVELDITAETAIVREDIDGDMDRIASRIAWYGHLLATLIAYRDKVDDDYRHWRAVRANQCDPKLAEWRVKMAIESDPGFARHRQAIREANELVVRVEKALDALEIKADLLRSVGARQRAELEATGMSTPASRSAEARTEGVRSAMRRRRFGRRESEDETTSEESDDGSA